MATIGELRRALDDIAQLCSAAGAKGAAKDLKLVSDALKLKVDSDASTVLSTIRKTIAEGLTKPRAGRKAVSRATPKTAARNNDAIERHLASLRTAGTNRQLFDMTFEALTSDKALTAADTGEIARRYSDSVTKYKSVKAAHADISRAFVRQARFENKLR
jgi:hypothetical protein